MAEPGRATAFDGERSRIFLEKADLVLADARLASLRSTGDEALGIDGGLLRDAMAAFGIAASTQVSRAPTQGTFHRLYDVREPGAAPRLLRVAALAGSSASDLMALECRVMTALRAHGFPVPACEYRELKHADAPRGLHLLERAAGKSLTAIDDDEERMLVALGGVGRFLARLHAVSGTGFGPISLARFGDAERPEDSPFPGVHAHWDDYVFVRLEEHLVACESAGAITGSEASDIAARFAAARATLRGQASALLHGDPGSHNFMVDETGVRAVIDWEDALLGDPLFDLASLCTFHPERRHAAIWSAHGTVPAAGSDTWTRFWLYFLRISLAKTVHRQRFAYADRPGRPPASQRIQLALKRLGERG